MTSGRPARLLDDGTAALRPDVARELARILVWALPERERIDRCRTPGDVWEAVRVMARSETVVALERNGDGFVSAPPGDGGGVIDTATAAARAGLSVRRMQQLAPTIPGARRIGRSWAIPADWSAAR